MADAFPSQADAVPILQDDLLRDRVRQFMEFLDDEVGVGTDGFRPPASGSTIPLLSSFF
jgi:hypothetical protein